MTKEEFQAIARRMMTAVVEQQEMRQIDVDAIAKHDPRLAQLIQANTDSITNIGHYLRGVLSNRRS